MDAYHRRFSRSSSQANVQHVKPTLTSSSSTTVAAAGYGQSTPHTPPTLRKRSSAAVFVASSGGGGDDRDSSKRSRAFADKHRSQSLSAQFWRQQDCNPTAASAATGDGRSSAARSLRRFSSLLRVPKALGAATPFTPPPILSPVRGGSGLFHKLSVQGERERRFLSARARAACFCFRPPPRSLLSDCIWRLRADNSRLVTRDCGHQTAHCAMLTSNFLFICFARKS